MKYRKNLYDLITFTLFLICLIKFQCALSQCADGEWNCDNGQCIDDEDKCDGIVNCDDRSDEIAENCIQFYDTCPSYAFKCRYGACIANARRCNNKTDCADNSDELICKETSEASLQGQCPEDEMQCLNSKECIDANVVCDGRINCSDGSDESVQVCIGYGCHSVGFQCGYGACIVGDAKCNGTIECADGSDEAWELCKTPRKKTNGGFTTNSPVPTRPLPTPDPTSTLNCQIPNKKLVEGMVIRLHPGNFTIGAGLFVENYAAVHMECNDGFSLRGQRDLICINGSWNINFPSCSRFCDLSLLEGISTRALCETKSGPRKCKNEISPNTKISIYCAAGFARTPTKGLLLSSINKEQLITCLPGGIYDKQRQPCEQICGKVASSENPLTKHGIPIKPSMAPWHVALYVNYNLTTGYTFFCSGSIISPRIIISAAHCFWDQANKIVQRNVNYQIIAGKGSRNYTSSDEASQTRDVETFYIPSEYADRAGRFLDDFAIVILKTPLEYTETVASVCIPTNLRNSAVVLNGVNGFITGYGLYNRLERVRMKTLSYETCYNISPKDTRIASDKFCINNNDGASVCGGDSGGGFITENLDDENEITYKLLGIISNTPAVINECSRVDKDGYVAVTGIRNIAHELKIILSGAFLNDTQLF